VFNCAASEGVGGGRQGEVKKNFGSSLPCIIIVLALSWPWLAVSGLLASFFDQKQTGVFPRL